MFQLIQNQKTYSFVPKSDQNHYIDQNVAKSALKTPKHSQFSLKTFFSKNFGAEGAKKLVFHVPKTPSFLKVGSPWGESLLQKISDLNYLS